MYFQHSNYSQPDVNKYGAKLYTRLIAYMPWPTLMEGVFLLDFGFLLEVNIHLGLGYIDILSFYHFTFSKAQKKKSIVKGK